MRFIEDGFVHRGEVFVGRYICPSCLRTFRFLPPFLQRFKRFSTPSILEVAGRVLKTSRMTYQNATSNPPPNRTRLFYANHDSTTLAPSTAWRWIQWMALFMSEFLKRRPEVGKEVNDTGHTFSTLQVISEKTKEYLYMARRLLLAQVLDSS